ncbi:MAG: hypothetical protein ACRDB0_05095 [Paraclostridium sp.]
MRELLFKGEYNAIKDACELDRGDCEKCMLYESVDVYVAYECHDYEMTICELMDNISKIN